MLDLSSREIGSAIDIVREAARLARHIQGGMAVKNLTKADLSPVTVADFALQALVGRALDHSFPDDPLVAEERAADLRRAPEALEMVMRFLDESVPGVDADSICRWIDRGLCEATGRFWTLDPIDGTKGYLRGGQYAVALALIVDGAVRIGVLGCPNLDRGCGADLSASGALIAAARGQGTWSASLDKGAGEEFGSLRVSECRAGAEARLLRSYESRHTNVVDIAALGKALGIRADPVLMDSQAKYAVLAAGNAELLVRFLSPDAPDYREKIWDHAAGSIIIEEAGGRVSDLDGRPLDFTAGRTLARNRGMIASNGHLHGAVLEALARLERRG